jgi:hypothetical protein
MQAGRWRSQPFCQALSQAGVNLREKQSILRQTLEMVDFAGMMDDSLPLNDEW